MQIGEDIPPVKFTTIELGMPLPDLKRYAQVHHVLSRSLGMDLDKYRENRLRH